MIRRRVVRVPASSANLGPGFDCMAAALALHLELEVLESGEFAVESDLPVARGRENLCVLHAVVGMKSLANNVSSVIHQNRANIGIR